MASLAQYSAAIHDATPVDRPSPGFGTRWVGIAIYLAAAALVVLAAIQSA
ncbi:MAG: hypothetical protein KDC46_02675 [Thermoleophilia bacterium]|nr:hypothetical protein [Thermoleophilia bacterium]